MRANITIKGCSGLSVCSAVSSGGNTYIFHFESVVEKRKGIVRTSPTQPPFDLALIVFLMWVNKSRGVILLQGSAC